MIDWKGLRLTSELRSLSTSATFKMAYAMSLFAEFRYPEGVRMLAESAELSKRALEVQRELEAR